MNFARWALIGLPVASAGCSNEAGLPPKPLRAAYDAAYRLFAGTDPYWRCAVSETTRDGLHYISSIPVRDCYSWAAPRRFSGIYIDEFEGQRFIEGAVPASVYRPADKVWVAFDGRSDLSAAPEIASVEDGSRIWEITFIGRKTTDEGHYGHMGMSDGEVLVDRVVSARLLSSYAGYVPESVLVR